MTGLSSVDPAQADTTITVGTLADAPAVPPDTVCSLREALANADADADTTSGQCSAGSGEDLITFSVSGTVTLLGPLPAITDPDGLVIDGGGSVAVSGADRGRVLQVAPYASLELRALTIQRGMAPAGGAIANSGDLTIRESLLLSNQAAVSGGAIWNVGTLLIEDSLISSNTATVSGGGVYSQVGSLTMKRSTVSLNRASLGAGIHNDVGSARFDDGILSHNRAAALGGGLYNNRGPVGVSGSTISDNRAGASGGAAFSDGGLNVSRSTLSRNEAGLDGGALYGLGALTVTDSTVSENDSAGSGGAIYAKRATLSVRRSGVTGNHAGSDGGGIYGDAAAMNIGQSTFSDNSAGRDGGAVFSASGTTLLSNSALISNSDGALYVARGSATVSYSTLAENTAGGAIADGSTITFSSTIVSQNVGGNCVGAVQEFGYNLEFATGAAPSCGFSDHAVWGDPKLGPIEGVGGSKPSISPGEDSPALDAIPLGVGTCGTSTTPDIRGAGRPQAAACDIGAVEVQRLSAADASGSEADGAMLFAVTLSGPAVTPVQVRFDTSDGSAVAGQDYYATSGTLVIAVGETTAEIAVPLVGDDVPEPDEMFVLAVTPGGGATVGTTSARGTISDDDS